MKDQVYKMNRDWAKRNNKRFSRLCQESRKRRVERLRQQGVTNAWCVVTRGDLPKYKEKTV